MRTWSEVFRQRPLLWATPLALLTLALLSLLFYRANYAGESAGLERRLEDKEKQLAQVITERKGGDLLLERAEVNRRLITELYRDRFATRRQRLTQITDEVKSLARKAGLDPRAISYPEEQIEDFALIERSFTFSVTGTYGELRSFINFLELTPSFLTLRKISIDGNEKGGAELDLRLELSTLFAADSGAPVGEATATEPATAGPAGVGSLSGASP